MSDTAAPDRDGMPPLAIILMGPAGAGKSTIGTRLARALGWRFLDADAFHSPGNLARLARGEALRDADRAPWLARLADEIALAVEGKGEPVVLACSALRRAYRQTLLPRGPEAARVRFLYLRVHPAELARRLRTRTAHVAGPALLDSQLSTLEEPASGEAVLVLDGERTVEALVEEIRALCGV